MSSLKICPEIGIHRFFDPLNVADQMSFVQGSANPLAPGCENALGKLRQRWYETAVTKFTKPGVRGLADPCTARKGGEML